MAPVRLSEDGLTATGRHALHHPAAHMTLHPEYLRLFGISDRTAALLDSKYRVPYTRVRFGWDAIVGLLPVVGDLAAAAVSLHLVRRAHTLGADSRLASRMVLNVLVDALLGASRSSARSSTFSFAPTSAI